MKASLFYLPTLGNRGQIEAGLAGMRTDLYQQMLREVSEQVRQPHPARRADENNREILDQGHAARGVTTGGGAIIAL